MPELWISKEGDVVAERSQSGFVTLPAGEPWLPGLGLHRLVSHEQSSGAMTLLEVLNPSAGGPPLHIHRNCDEWFYVLEGAYLVRIGDEESLLTSGGSAYAPLGIAHTWASTGKVPNSRILGATMPAVLEGYLVELERLIQTSASEEALRALDREWQVEMVGPPLVAG